jgi:DNA polymerase
VTLYPIYHPAAALYTPAMLRTLEDDFRRIPGLLAEQTGASAQVIQFPVASPPAAERPAEQLGLF